MSFDQQQENDPFNLNDFDEEAERARLKSIEPGEKPSEDLQKKFTDYILRESEQEDPSFLGNRPLGANWQKGFTPNIVAEKLFASGQREVDAADVQTKYFRSYFTKPGEEDEFDIGSMNSFIKISVFEGKIVEANIDLGGETGPNSKHYRGEFDNFSVRFDKFGLHLNREDGYGILRLDYQEDGKLTDVEIQDDNTRDGEDNSTNVFVVDLSKRDKRDLDATEDDIIIDLNSISEAEPTIITNKLGVKCEIISTDMELDGGRIVKGLKISRWVNGVVADTILIPTECDIDSKLNSLIPKPLAQDLLKADTQLDEKWKSVDFKDFDIKWERPTPDPV